MMYYLGLQITLKLDPETEIKKYGPRPGPLDEIEVMVIAFLDNSTKIFKFFLVHVVNIWCDNDVVFANQMWSERLEKITSVSEQLCSQVALNILMNLEDAHSTYAQSFHLVKREIAKVRT